MNKDNENSRSVETDRRTYHINEIVTNAVDFLSLSTEEFDSRLNHSVIAFYSAVELILKARLMSEHWSLVVLKDADRVSFENGDFVSVSFDESCRRLNRVVGEPIPERTRRYFNDVRKHRNKLVHFYQDTTTSTVREKIAVEQLRAWHGLLGLVRTQWGEVFSNHVRKFEDLDAKFSHHRSYLQTRFESLEGEIKKLKSEGVSIETCSSCSFISSRLDKIFGDVHESNCLVCRTKIRWMKIGCSYCDNTLRHEGDDGSYCADCKGNFSIEELFNLVDDDPATPDNYFDLQTPANCYYCDGYHTVASYRDKFVCISCFHITDALSSCECCGENSNGDMQGSGWRGCGQCEGRSGSLRD